MMNREIGLMWVAALRSGEYEQGREALLCGGAYCCLGVLCDLHLKATGQGRWAVPPDEMPNAASYVVGDSCETDHPPMPVLRWSGLSTDLAVLLDGFDGEGPAEVELIALNDARRWTFSQIADAIEANLPAAA